MPEATNGYSTIEVSEAQMQAYDALQTASYRIGQNNFRRLGPAKYDRSGAHIGGYFVTAEHSEIVKAMPQVFSGGITPEGAMALLHQPDIMRQRIMAYSQHGRRERIR